MAKYFKGGTFEEQAADPVVKLMGSGQYRDIPASIPGDYMAGRMSQEDALAAITGTPVFNPNIGPQINTGNGVQSAQAAGFQLNPGLGAGFSTNTSKLNQLAATYNTPASSTSQPKIGAVDYTLHPGESMDAYRARTGGYAPTQAQQNLAVSQIQNPVQAPSQGNVGSVSPNLPEQQLGSVADSYYQGLLQQVTNATAQLETERNKQLADVQKQKDDTQKAVDEIRTLQQEGILQQGNTAAQEKEAKLNQLNIETARFDENYNKIQGLASTLTDLMTTGNQLIQQQKNTTGLVSILSPRIAQTVSDVAAQAGVIQAAISVYNGQMNQAQNQMTNAVNVITSAYSDQLDYYKTLYNFYESKASDKEAKLTNLTKDERMYLESKINSLEAQKNFVQANANNLQQAMTDPDTALAYAEAGVTLNDSPQQINTKLAKYGYTKEVTDMSNKMAQDGYMALISGSAPAGSVVVTTTDSMGKTKTYYKKASATSSTTSTAETKKADIASMNNALKSATGSDGYIDPRDWQTAKQNWIGAGYSSKEFDDTFSVYKNPNDTYP